MPAGSPRTYHDLSPGQPSDVFCKGQFIRVCCISRYHPRAEIILRPGGFSKKVVDPTLAPSKSLTADRAGTFSQRLIFNEHGDTTSLPRDKSEGPEQDRRLIDDLLSGSTSCGSLSPLDNQQLSKTFNFTASYHLQALTKVIFSTGHSANLVPSKLYRHFSISRVQPRTKLWVEISWT